MVSRKSLQDEKERYTRFIEDVEQKTQESADAEKAPLLEQQQKILAKIAKLKAKVERRSKKTIADDEEMIRAMGLFEKRDLKKYSKRLKAVNAKIDDIENKYSAISENTTRPMYQAQQGLNALLQLDDLIQQPSSLVGFTSRLQTDLLRLEQNPGFEADIRRRWSVLQEVVAELLKDPKRDLTDLKQHLEDVRQQNDRQIEGTQFYVDDTRLVVKPMPKGAQKTSMKAQLKKKELVIAMSQEYSELLKNIVTRIPAISASSQEVTNEGPAVTASSSSRPASVRFSAPQSSSPQQKAVGKVAKRIQYFEELEKKNQEREEQSKGPRRR